MVKNFMVKISALILWCLVLAGCFVDHLLNYPFRVKEIIASFPIDPDSREPQIFVLDNIQTDKRFYYDDNQLGPYRLNVCTTNPSTNEDFKGKLLMTFSTDGLKPKTKIATQLAVYDAGCHDVGLLGWGVASFVIPNDFDLDQKVTLTLQIQKDENGFLKKLPHLRLVVLAGRNYP